MRKDNGAERVQRINSEEFVGEFIRKNRPVIVTDAMENWRALKEWTPEFFANNFGDWDVPVYGTYFDLRKVMKLKRYVLNHLDTENPKDKTSYVRWFTLHQPVAESFKFPWADEAFKVLRPYWEHPYFLPKNSYLFPYCSSDQLLDIPSDTTVPSKALYLSPKGAVTNLHMDYWGSDAVICQIYGKKEVVLYSPDQTQYLMKETSGVMVGTSGGRQIADIRNPDTETFPDFSKTSPTVVDTLHEGEIAYVPSGWLHHVDTLSNSITLTWNFVHIGSFRNWFRYLMGGPPEKELRDIEYITYDDKKRLR